jgi:hypothetical protein
MRRIGILLMLGLAAGAVAAPGKRELKVREAGGREVFTIKWEASGAKLVDPGERELARLKPHGDRLKIEDAHDALVGEVSGDAGKLSIKDVEKNVVFVLRRQADGDYKLEDGHDGLLAKLERKGPDSVRVEDAAGKTLFKVKNKHGKVVLTDAAEAPVLGAVGPASLMGFAVLGLDRLSPPQKAAIFYRLDELAVP